MFGQLLPSSIMSLLAPAALASFSPASLPPVNATTRTLGLAARSGPSTSPFPVSVLRARGGIPDSMSIAAILSAVRGVSEAGLKTTELPAAKAGPSLWASNTSGLLNAVMAATTPTGTLIQ